MSAEDAGRIRDRVGESCGQPLRLQVEDLAVLRTDAGPVVGVAVSGADILLRDPDGSWHRHYGEELVADLLSEAPAPRRDGPLEPLDPVRPRSPEPSAQSPSPSERPEQPSRTPACASPSLVTPAPPNNSGPASVYEYCGIASGP